jgi:hypothetical protein
MAIPGLPRKTFLRALIVIVLLLGTIVLSPAQQPVGTTPQGTQTYDVKIELGITTTMRDGVRLVSNVFRPNVSGQFPVIVMRTPYNRNESRRFEEGRFFASRGYVYVVQDCRGRYDSEGEFYPLRDDALDGYDSIEWAAMQPWSNGRVGTYGGSYLGWNQWLAATQRPPHLKAMVALVTPPDPFYNTPYENGAFMIFGIDWYTRMRFRVQQPAQQFDLAKVFWHLPLITMDVAATGTPSVIWRDLITHSTFDDYWKAVSYEEHYDKIDLPVLHISGWFDDDQPGTFRNFVAMRERGRKHQKMVIGPWPHAVNSTTKMGPLEFGPSAKIDLHGLVARWFDRFLKNVSNGIDLEPAVRIFVMGDNIWRDEPDWPLPGTKWAKYYFHSSGQANSSSGDGLLSTTAPREEPADRYTYDPANPTPFINPPSSSQIGGPDDYREVHTRNDVLVYTTTPLEQDVEITGPLSVKLFASSTAPDTDFVAMVFDVRPDGYVMRLQDGIVRARFRESVEKPSLLEPGKVYEFTIPCWRTSIVIPKGHRIRVHIASSNFPKFDRNPNSGHPLGLDAELRTAEQTVFHDGRRPSYVVLPVIPRP